MQKRIALKIIVIFLLGLLLLIPLMMIQGKINERERYLQDVKHSISSSWTGSQIISSPILVIPYDVLVAREVHAGSREPSRTELVSERLYSFVTFDQAEVGVKVQAEKRFKGIYSVPVYSSEIVIESRLKAELIQSAINEISDTAGYERTYDAYIGSYIQDMRGIGSTPSFSVNGVETEIVSGSGLAGLAAGLRVPLQLETLLDQSSEIDVKLSYKLNGMENFEVLPSAREISLDIKSNWPHPEFIGAFLPGKRKVEESGFTASWMLNEFSTNIIEIMNRCSASECYGLTGNKMGVKLFESVDVYQQTERAIKYAILFIFVSFIAFFVFEAIREVSIHPIQYVLVGLALAIFYLLLIALSEHISFSSAYAVASLACTSLISIYLRYVLHSWKESCGFGLSLLGLYVMLYVILQQEDFALLSGSLLTFVLLSVLMISTRNIDWYALTKVQQSYDAKQ